MAARHMTQKWVDGEKPDGRPRLIRDAKTPGLMLAVNKTRKTWKIPRDLWRDRRLIKPVRHAHQARHRPLGGAGA